MYGLTRVMNISFDLNDAFFFGAIISATDPGKILQNRYKNTNLAGGMQVALNSIHTSGTFFHAEMAMKTFQ